MMEENQVENSSSSLEHDSEPSTPECLSSNQVVLHSTPNGDCDIPSIAESAPGDEDFVEEQSEHSSSTAALLCSIKENDDVFTTDLPKPGRKLGTANANLSGM